MASNFSPPSKSESNFSLPQLKQSATSEKISTTTAGIHPRIVLKLSSQSKNKTEDVVSNVEDKTLVSEKGEESAKDETKEVQKRKITFPTFSISLGREKIEADLLAMTGSSVGKGSAANKKRTMSPQNSFQDDLSSFSTDNSSDSTVSNYNPPVETSMTEPTLLDRRRKMTREFTTATDNNKNNDMVAINAKDQKQTLVSKELQEPENFKTWENTRTVSNVVNQTLISKTRNVAESLPFESTQPGITLTKDNGETKKRTFSTFSVSLTREEIEADFVAMGASMRTRRIKKRPNNVQRELSNLFPGLRLKYITPDDYRVREDKN